MTRLNELSGREGVTGVAEGRFTVEALVRAHLEHIDANDVALKAWQFIDHDLALAAARAADVGDGAARGLLVGIKDVIATADMPTTYGSPLYQGHQPPFDAVCVAEIRQSGAIPLGKTVSTEFAAISPGPTVNPHHAGHTPGGSSSGSAAAVASNMVPVALGTQTSGSTIRPASFCGVVGYKPTYELIEKTGVKTLAAGLDTVGIFARDVGDVVFYMANVHETAKLAPAVPFAPKVGLFRGEAWDLATEPVETALATAVAALERAGASVRDIPVAAPFDKLLPVHDILMGWGMVRGLYYEHRFHPERITAKTREMLDQRAGETSQDLYAAAEADALHARARLDELFGDCDVILTPAATGEAPEGHDFTGDASFNRGWTTLQVPAITVPAVTGPKGLPVGVQLVARRGADRMLLAAAAFLEQALKRS